MNRVLTTSRGTRTEAFAPVDWGLGLTTALMWGSANYFIAEALDEFEPGLVTFARIGLGFLTLLAFPGARQAIDRADWARVFVVAVTWVALPFTLFPIAQQWIASSVAGMLIGSLPLFTAALATLLLRSLPPRRQIVGLLVGFGGVVAISWPSLDDADSTALGALLVLVAVASYAVAINISVPLTQRYGPRPIMARALGISTLLVAPFGLVGVPSSTFSWPALGASVVLGVGASGIAFLCFTKLAARVGPTRGASINYLIPVVAIVLGVTIRDESLAAVSAVGVALVLFGAYLVSGREAPADTRHPEPMAET